MPQFLSVIYLPDDFDPSKQDPSVAADIYALNEEMIAAGIRKFACGLGSSHTFQAQANGDVLVTDGPYLETKEQVGGLSIIEVPTLEEAKMWGRKAAKACRVPVEVREIFFMPAPEND